ncbi:MAG: hypothetical protein GY778_18815 [bacterium]|nr:hypothetical protein [bacterium]
MLEKRNGWGAVRLRTGRVLLAVLGMAAGAVALSCGIPASSVFNPAFVDVLDAEGTGANATVENASGHIPVVFVNRTQFDPNLINYMNDLKAAGRLSGVADPFASLDGLRPRVRVRVRVTFENGNSLPFEFVDGDSLVEIDVRDADLEGGGAIDTVDPRLTEDDLARMVATCGVVRVEIEGDPQVFVPVITRRIQVEVGDESGEQTRVLIGTDLPAFRPVLPDEINADRNTTLLRNYGVREAPASVRDLRCGAMVGIVMSGTVQIPFTGPEDEPEDEFVQEHSEVPGFITTDTTREASIPGRYKFELQAL